MNPKIIMITGYCRVIGNTFIQIFTCINLHWYKSKKSIKGIKRYNTYKICLSQLH